MTDLNVRKLTKTSATEVTLHQCIQMRSVNTAYTYLRCQNHVRQRQIHLLPTFHIKIFPPKHWLNSISQVVQDAEQMFHIEPLEQKFLKISNTVLHPAHEKRQLYILSLLIWGLSQNPVLWEGSLEMPNPTPSQVWASPRTQISQPTSVLEYFCSYSVIISVQTPED